MGKFEKGKRPTQAQSYAEPQRAPKKKKQKKQSRLGLIGAAGFALKGTFLFGLVAGFRENTRLSFKKQTVFRRQDGLQSCLTECS